MIKYAKIISYLEEKKQLHENMFLMYNMHQIIIQLNTKQLNNKKLFTDSQI